MSEPSPKKPTVSPEETDRRVQDKRGPAAKKKTDESEGSPSLNPYENSVVYRKNKITGEWEVINPAGSIAYNYLYREDYPED